MNTLKRNNRSLYLCSRYVQDGIELFKEPVPYEINYNPTSSAEQLGTTSGALWSALESLKKADEISEFPRIIAGLILTQTKSGIELKGIGHMKFDEY